MLCVYGIAVGEGCLDWPTVESRLVSYRVNSGQLEASISCQHGFQMQLNDSLMTADVRHQIQRLTARCHGNVWDIKPPHCYGMFFSKRIRSFAVVEILQQNDSSKMTSSGSAAVLRLYPQESCAIAKMTARCALYS